MIVSPVVVDIAETTVVRVATDQAVVIAESVLKSALFFHHDLIALVAVLYCSRLN